MCARHVAGPLGGGRESYPPPPSTCFLPLPLAARSRKAAAATNTQGVRRITQTEKAAHTERQESTEMRERERARERRLHRRMLPLRRLVCLVSSSLLSCPCPHPSPLRSSLPPSLPPSFPSPSRSLAHSTECDGAADRFVFCCRPAAERTSQAIRPQHPSSVLMLASTACDGSYLVASCSRLLCCSVFLLWPLFCFLPARCSARPFAGALHRRTSSECARAAAAAGAKS